ncbi:DinB family protein [Chitinophaga defluvii]|uniref:DinB family protein n=1 Tax=Chitinophaga defluvii TaxID=3163343 RepID=A0ABV2TDY3_9BACT
MNLNHQAIHTLLDNNFNSFSAFVRSLPDHRFTASPYGKWSAGQQLDHLIKSTRPVISALGLPKIALRFWGKPTQPSRTYDQLVADYQHLLQGGLPAVKAYMPGVIYLPQRPTLLHTFAEQQTQLLSRLQNQTAADLDNYLVPHPSLGKITLREALYFTAYHMEHHLNTLRDHEEQSHTWENQLQQLIY